MKKREEAVYNFYKCTVYPPGSLGSYEYAVVCTFYRGKLILSRHHKRNTWEMQGGHIEHGETPSECAARELFEESGIRNAELYAVCDYIGGASRDCAYGMFFLAIAHSLSPLPDSEMVEIKTFNQLPPELTYPELSQKLYAEAKKHLEDISHS